MDLDAEYAYAVGLEVATIMLILMEEVSEEEAQREDERRCWVTDLCLERDDIWHGLLRAIEGEGPNDRLNEFLRFNREEFNHLLALIGPKIAKQDTTMRKAITAKQRLAITLRFLATGDSYESISFMFRVSSRSVSLIVQEVCDHIIQELKEYVKLPSNEGEWLKISKAFEEQWNFPHVIGSIDGKHVTIKAPANSGSQYFNYTKTFSIVLLGVSDANYNFIFADVGCQGRISDGGVFANSPIYQKLERKELHVPVPEILRVPYKVEVPYYLLGDQAFALKEYCMRPFAGMHAADSMERHFNYRQSRARRTVENAFGILVKVFRVLSRPIELEPPIAEKVVLAAIHLHNFRRRHLLYNYSESLLPRSTNQGSSFASEDLNDVPLPDSMLRISGIPIRSTRAVQNIRTHLAQHFQLNDPLLYSLPQPRRAT